MAIEINPDPSPTKREPEAAASQPVSDVDFPDDTSRHGSVDMPIDMAQRLVANARRMRWLLAALVMIVGVLIVSGRVSIPEAALIFTVLTITAFLSSAPRLDQPRAPLARAVAKVRARPRAPSLEQLVEAWPQAVVLVDEKAVITSVNALARDLMGIRKVGDPLSFRMRDPDVLRAVQRALADGVGDTCTLVERVPAERRITLHIRPFTEGPTVHHVLIVIEDETDAYHAERMRSDFVANASHELRTPLASISGCIETLQGPAQDDPVGKARFLSLMGQQAGRMTALIDDLLSLNRIEMQAHRQPTDCVDLVVPVREAIDLVRGDAEKAELIIEADLPETATVQGDAAELRQVAINLLANAVKYGGSGDRVDVTIGDALEGGVRMIELRVRDHGPGIEAAHLPRLTERFYRAHEQTNPLAKGTGLGLAIVKHIVARHKGRLLITSPKGEGATFAVRVPYMTPKVVQPAHSIKDKQKQSLKLSHD